MSEMMSVGVLARRFGVSIARVRYAARSRGIEHIGVVGRIHVFDEPAAKRIGEALVLVSTRKLDIEVGALARIT